jgi:PAS domain S-box-containing protein
MRYTTAMTDTNRDDRAGDALRDTNARLEAAIAAADVAVFNQDRDLRYTWIRNPSLGRSAESVIGKRDIELFDNADDAARLEAIKRAVIDSGRDSRQEFAVSDRGVTRYFDLSVRPQRDAGGAIIGITGAAIEITERKRIEAGLSFLSNLAATLTPLTSSAQVADAVASAVLNHFGLSRCLLVAIDPAGQTATVFHERSRIEPSLLGAYTISDYHSDAERRALASGEPVVIDDVRAARPADAVAHFEKLGIRSMLDVPYLSDGQWRFVLSAVRAEPHAWQPGDIELLKDVASRAYLRLERARAEERLRAAHDTFHHLVEQSPFGIYAVDSDFRLVQVSAGAQKVFAQVHPLLGRDFSEVLRQLWPEPFATQAIGIFRHTLETGEPYHAPSTVETRHDIGVVESYDWKTERMMLPDGRWGVVCHFYDLSERLKFEEELREADRHKDLFLAMLAHELRNPLAPIRTAAGVLRTEADESGIIQACADTIERQTAQMARLLDDLLDVSRLSRGRLLLQRSPVSLAGVIAVAVETCRPSIDAQRQRLAVDSADADVMIDGDAVRLAQVFANLLHNASKFGGQGGRIDVRARREGDQVVVRVTDSGIGIPAELQASMFEMFVQGPENKGGLGIGLPLAKRLVEMHSGTLTAQSEGSGRGSEFTVRLPVTAHAPTEPVRATREAPTVHARRVLIVDDNPDVAEISALLLKGAGCDVRVAYDGHEALATAETFQPEMVFMDLGMPGLDGYEVSRRIRAAAWGQTVQLIAVSGWARPEDQERSAAAGFNRHLVKPVDPLTLIEIAGS